MVQLEWVPIRSAFTNRVIGAIGFVGDRAAVAVSFYEDADWNQDGKLSKIERYGKYIPVAGNLFFKKGRAVTEVVMAARGDPDVMLRDPSYSREAVKQFQDFATGLIFTGLYEVYFSRAVSGLAGGAAGAITDNVVKGYVIRKGMEKLVQDAYDSAVKAGTALR